MRRSDPTPDSSRKRFTFRPEVSWMSVRDAPRRPRNTNRPLFQAASTGASLSDRPQRLKQKVPIEERVQRKSELVAEDAFQQGMRLLGQEQYAEAANLLQQAVATMPQAMEYRLYAAWASYRACRDDEQLRRMRPGLTELAVNTARFERTHPFPPFVRAHMALADGEEAQALALFRDALNRDPANRDAQRHVRLLTSRLK
jgi:tetratricopeptide (TPR) repeat protein